MATARDLIESSLREIGVLAEGETASAAQASDGLTRLNRLIDRLSADKLSLIPPQRTTWTLVASQASYTLGSGGNINLAKPVFVEAVGFIDTTTTPATEYPLTKLTDQAFIAISQKALTSTYPSAWYYRHSYPLGTLTLHPVPTGANLQGVLYAPVAVPQLTSLSTDVTVPPAYEEMLMTNLAVLLCPAYDRQVHPVLAQTARESLATLKRSNTRLADLTFERAALIGRQGSGYDIDLG